MQVVKPSHQGWQLWSLLRPIRVATASLHLQIMVHVRILRWPAYTPIAFDVWSASRRLLWAGSGDVLKTEISCWKTMQTLTMWERPSCSLLHFANQRKNKLDAVCDMIPKSIKPRKRGPAARASRLSFLDEISQMDLQMYTAAQLSQILTQRAHVRNSSSSMQYFSWDWLDFHGFSGVSPPHYRVYTTSNKALGPRSG